MARRRLARGRSRSRGRVRFSALLPVPRRLPPRRRAPPRRRRTTRPPRNAAHRHKNTRQGGLARSCPRHVVLSSARRQLAVACLSFPFGAPCLACNLRERHGCYCQSRARAGPPARRAGGRASSLDGKEGRRIFLVNCVRRGDASFGSGSSAARRPRRRDIFISGG
jgi:hypothetical protein